MREMSKEKWEGIRARGKRHFVARGMAASGIIPTVATVLVYGFEFLWTGRADLNSKVYATTILSTLFFLLLGYSSAERDWSSLEREYSSSPAVGTMTGHEKSNLMETPRRETAPNPTDRADV